MNRLNATIMRLSRQALLGRRRGLVLVLIPGVLVVLAVIVRALTEDAVGYEAVITLGFTLALPLVALLAATAVLGPEVDDGSIVYLISKPVSRHRIALSKFAVAWAATMVLGVLPLLVSGWSSTRRTCAAVAWGVARRGGGHGVHRVVPRARGVHPSRGRDRAALRPAVGRVLGIVLEGIRWVAIGAWGRGVAERDQPAGHGPGTGLTYALVAAVVLSLGSLWFTGDRLRSFTLRGDE